ncbi:MAG: hypothetical protein GXW99_07340 [Clostridiales bacterium]|nr:hypothetical protein [Clostridiales bacterium]
MKDDITTWGSSLSNDGPAWPTDAAGEKVRAVRLKFAFDSTADADMTISYLAAYGVPCFKYYDVDGGAGKVINGFSGYGASLYVPQSQLEDAQALLDAQPIEDEEESGKE